MRNIHYDAEGDILSMTFAVRSQVLRIIARPPVANLVHVTRMQDATPSTRLDQIFTPATLQALAA
jgi:hypothetical protein